jgi:hypothetical protein
MQKRRAIAAGLPQLVLLETDEQQEHGRSAGSLPFSRTTGCLGDCLGAGAGCCSWPVARLEQKRPALPDELRILLTLWHPRQAIGEGADRPPDGGPNVPQLAARPAGSACAIRRAVLTLVGLKLLHLRAKQRLEGRRAGT